MKKTLSKILAAITVLALVFCLAGCGNSKKYEAIDAFNSTSASFNDVATLINENSSAIDGDIIETFQEMSALLSQYKDILESNSEVSDEKYDEMIEWFGSLKDWTKDAKADIENMIDPGAPEK